MAERTEAYYDAVIAPALLEVAKLCKAAGMPMVACVEYELNCCGLTADHGDIHDCGPQFRIARYGAFARGNIDALITACIRDDAKHIPEGGHTNSVYMRQLESFRASIGASMSKGKD